MQEIIVREPSKLIDSYQRRFEYLRLSITEKCNFKCQYCLPNGYQKRSGPEFLSLEEIRALLTAFVSLGVKKVRITGGEPTIRRDFDEILALIASFPEIKEIAVTTNASRLAQNIEKWHQLGLTNLNVSVDSFTPEHFKLITGENLFHQVIAGIEKALTIPSLTVKINTVLMKNLNDNLDDYLGWIKTNRVDIRFIELMETGDLPEHFKDYHLSGDIIVNELQQRGWVEQVKVARSGPAKMYSHPDYLGRLGLIMPYSKNFCQGCNRLRVSSTGKLHYCLFGESAVDLRPYLQDPSRSSELTQAILHSLTIKPETHSLHQHQAGLTKNLSIIGG